MIGPYDTPKTRLPGAGGAPEIAAHARQTFVMLRASPRSFVERLDFRTSAGYLDGSGARARSGAPGGGPRAVITDFGMLTPHAQSEELQLSALFADASIEEARSRRRAGRSRSPIASKRSRRRTPTSSSRPARAARAHPRGARASRPHPLQ